MSQIGDSLPGAGSRMGVDIGGTFTDVAVVDPDGSLRVGKVLTTPGKEHLGVLDAIERSETPLNDVRLLVHGTTLVINSLIERQGATVVLVTTKGFKDVHSLGRSNRRESFNLFFQREPVLVPRHMRLEVAERTLADGTIVARPESSELDELAKRITELGAEAVAIACLNAYVAPSNEEYIESELRKRIPDIFITRSSAISREWREFERVTTAAANAYVGPATDEYLARIESGVADRGFAGTFVMLDSNGGALYPATARQYPVRLVESGPVGGALGAADLARKLNLENIVTFDMGGTTAKSTFVESGQYPSSDLYWIGGYDRGFPLQVPCIDIVEIGAGGGSIAWTDDAGRLRVGPRSAGAAPGPACYGNGGTEPTVTDANVFLGRLPAEFFVSTINISPELSTQAIENLAEKLSIDPVRLATGIVALAEMSMAEVVRHQTVARGRDPRDFTLVAFGGAGPIHAFAVAAEVGIRRILIPASPGHFSAIGMLNANLRFDRREIFQSRLRDLDERALAKRLEKTAADLMVLLPTGGTTNLGEQLDQNINCKYQLALRYTGQEHTLLVGSEQDGLAVPYGVAGKFEKLFEAEYMKRFGHTHGTADVEVVEYIVVAERQIPKVNVSGTKETPGASGELDVYFGTGKPVRSRVIPRSGITVGATLRGPVLIYENGSTTVIPPNATATATPEGHLVIELDTVTSESNSE